MKSVFLLIGLSLLYSIDAQSQQKKLVPFKVMKGEQDKWGYKDSFTDKVIVYWHFDEALPFQNNVFTWVPWMTWKTS